MDPTSVALGLCSGSTCAGVWWLFRELRSREGEQKTNQWEREKQTLDAGHGPEIDGQTIAAYKVWKGFEEANALTAESLALVEPVDVEELELQQKKRNAQMVQELLNHAAEARNLAMEIRAFTLAQKSAMENAYRSEGEQPQSPPTAAFSGWVSVNGKVCRLCGRKSYGAAYKSAVGSICVSCYHAGWRPEGYVGPI